MDSERVWGELQQLSGLIRLSASDPVKEADVPSAFSLRSVSVKGKALWQLETRVAQQVFHENLE